MFFITMTPVAVIILDNLLDICDNLLEICDNLLEMCVTT